MKQEGNMNQSIFIIRHDFFDNPVAGKEFVHKLISENCRSEKLALVYDPLAEDFFTHVAKSNRDKYEEITKAFYSEIENTKQAVALKWYQLDEIATFHITFLTPMIYELDKKFGAYLLGCLPLLHYEPNLYVFFMMSAMDQEDLFLLIDGKYYLKLLETHINKFNDFVRDEKGKEKVKKK